MGTARRVSALALLAGLTAAGMITLAVGPTGLALVGALGAAIPVGTIYALFSAEADR